ncbi:MAG: BRO family protein [Intestinibacter bartlettii]|nr:BRO family protein [Intestinibacter bartlettii]
MKDLQIFKNEKFGQVRVVEIDNEPWFVGKDIVKALGYDLTTGTSYTQYIKKYCNQEDIKNYNKETQVQYTLEFDYKKLGQRGGLLINEYALYDLALESPLPSAKEFKKWVTHEVLPSIRKHGVYMTDDILERTLTDPDFMINLLTNLKEEKEKRRLAEERTKRLIHNSRTYTATEIAKELGFKSAKTFNKDLENKKIQYKVNGVWVLSADYSDKDYVSIKQQELDNGTVIYNRRWTGLGREWLLNEIYGYDK